MPDKRRHRGPHPADAGLFAEDQLPSLRAAVSDLSWLLTRGYAPKAAATLVGDRFRLTERQRLAVLRSACADASLARRREHALQADQVAGQELDIDGFNALTTVEAALAGGVLLLGRDSCYRDLTSMHGSYRKVNESVPALRLLGDALAELEAGPCRWLFDRPVSNSGRIGQITEDVAAERGWPWCCELCLSPDPVLVESQKVVVSADSVILDGCERWFNLAAWTVQRFIPQAWVVDLR